MHFIRRDNGLNATGALTEDTLVEWALLSGDRRVKAAAEPLRDMLSTARRHVRAQRRWRYLSTLIRTCSVWTHALTPEARAQARRDAPTRTTSTLRRERRPIVTPTPIPTRDPTLAGNEDPKTAGGPAPRHPTSTTQFIDTPDALADEQSKDGAPPEVQGEENQLESDSPDAEVQGANPHLRRGRDVRDGGG